MKKYLINFIILLFVSSNCFAVSIPLTHTQAPQPANWYDDLVFKNNSFSFEFIRTLGYSYTGGADAGECFSTARLVKDGDIQSWYQEWTATANRINALGDLMEKTGDFVSAREAYFRASNYYRTAGLYMVAKTDRNKSISAYAASKKAFLNGIKSMPGIKPVNIPYDKTYLPGYFIPATIPNAPLLIVHSGFDGTAEEIYFEVAVSAQSRNYNVLLFEGPGQGNVLRQQHLPFRYDWEHVVTLVVNYALTLPNIDKNKVALIGISMGGYLAARACAFDNRIKACILNGGVYSVAENIYKKFPPFLNKLRKTEPSKFDNIMYKTMKLDVTTAWFFNNAMWALDADSPSKVLLKLDRYTLKDVVTKIKASTLVINSEDDEFYKGQPEQLFSALTSPKTLLNFTQHEAAQAHCQMGAIAISNEKIFAWLKRNLG